MRFNYTCLLDSVRVRIAVNGVRGKSSLVVLLERLFRSRGFTTYGKVTGENPFSIKDGVFYPIPRMEGFPISLDENICEFYKYFPFDAMIVENQAITPYTIRVVNELLVKPHIIVVTNVRRDHGDSLGWDLRSVARSLGRGFSRASIVVCGEQRVELNSILERYARGVGALFDVVEVPEAVRGLPGVELVFIASRIMDRLGLDSMKPYEEGEALESILKHFTLRESSIGVSWFPGAKLNDIDSTSIVLKYMMDRYPSRGFMLVAYFRSDRPSRTISFTEFFDNIDLDRVGRIYLVGFGADYVYRRVKGRVREVSRILPDSTKSIEQIIQEARDTGYVIFTIGNQVNNFMRTLTAILEPGIEKTVTTIFKSN